MQCRLSKADLPSSIKHPVLLDKGHHITSLIVEDSHKRVAHGGVKPGAGENTLRRLAHFLGLDHPTKSDVTSGKKTS